VPQVASDPTIHVHNPHLPRTARPTQPSDRAPSPFESLLDDGAQAADQPAPPPPDNKAASTDGTQAPAKTNDCKAPASNDAATTTTKPEDQASANQPSNDKPVCDTKPAVNAELVGGVTAGDDSKPKSDDKAADGPKTDKPGVTAPTTIVQTNSPADAVAVAPAPSAALISTPVPDQDNQGGAPQQVTLVAETGLQMKSMDAGIPKAVGGKQPDSTKSADADKQVDADQSADEITDGAQPTTKATPETHPDKPQFTVSENDKDHVADARGELPANGHRGSPDAPAAVSTDSGTTASKIIADMGTQPTVPTTTTHAAPNAAAPALLVSQPGPQAAAIPLSGVAMEIAGKALAGKNRFDIRLDPPELGRIEVRLDVDRDGNVTSRMTVDRADTLDLLRRDASGLERALQDAGLKTADNSLQFSLRDQSMGQQQTGAGPDSAQMIVTDETLPPIDVIPQNYGRLAGTGSGIDIRV
jgi:chemotaxis protein MotD